MSVAALFVDLPNFYSRLLRSGIEEPRFLRDYFTDWLDFDMLATSLSESFSGIWVFYSGERLGPSSERLAGKFLQDYIRRINALEGVTARDANIGGEQREPVSYKCDQCQHEGVAENISEKGVDASLTVHLFDTMDSWDTAFLLSGDADFVPAVASLRRRGKIVIGVGFAGAAHALIQECYHYVNISEVFLREDVLLYSLFKKDGGAHVWLTDDIKHDPAFLPEPKIGMRVEWEPAGTHSEEGFILSEPHAYRIRFIRTGDPALTTRHQLLARLQGRFGDRVSTMRADDPPRITGYRVGPITELGIATIERKIPKILASIEGIKYAKVSITGILSAAHIFDEQTKSYKLELKKD